MPRRLQPRPSRRGHAAAGPSCAAPPPLRRRLRPLRPGRTAGPGPAGLGPAASPAPAASARTAALGAAGRRRRSAAPATAVRGGDALGSGTNGEGLVLSPVVRQLVTEHGLDPPDHRAPARAAGSPAETCSRSSTAAAAGGHGVPQASPPAAPPGARRCGRGCRAGRRRRAGKEPGRSPPRTSYLPGRRSARRDRAVHQHPPAHRRAHGALEGDLGAHALP